MRILFLSAWYPFPADNGSKIRVYNLLRALSAHHQVTLLAFVRSGDQPQPAPPGLCSEVIAVPWREYQPHAWRARLAALSTVPRSLIDTYSPEMAAQLQRVENSAAFDILIASTIDTAAYALRARTPVRILEEHNFTTRIMREQYEAQANTLSRLRYWLTWAKYRRYEARLYQHFDGVTMVSPVEADAVRELVGPALPLKVIPNCVDADYYKCDYVPVIDSCVFNGSLTYSANFDAMHFFLEEIWSQIRSARPSAHLRITGRTDRVAINRLSQHNGVTFTGPLPDIRPVVGASWACVVPVRVGGGSRVKILEALALGTPAVATHKGAEGLGLKPGREVLLADHPAEFAQATLHLLASESLRRELSHNGREIIRNQYDWRPVGREFETFLTELAMRRKA